jgi:amino acid adenylation domain-containing protein
MSVQGIEDIYSMTPLQQGLLFHTLLRPESGVYVDQFVLDVRGSLHVPAMESAWRQVISRHVVMRTSFHWENLSKPVQIVHREVELSLDIRDWRDRSPELQKDLLETYLKDDRQRGFDLSVAPLMRLALIQTMDDTYHFVWSFHHLILDGWSSDIVQTEVFALYEALSRGERLELESVTPFSAYIEWLRRQDIAAAEAFWREKLKGFRSSVSLAFGQASVRLAHPETDKMDLGIHLPLKLTAELQSFARRYHLTLNTVILGAWSLLLSRYTGEPEIVVGVIVSGRPETVSGVESMVGNFINTVPARIQVPGNALVGWLKHLQTAQLELRNYEYAPLVEIQKWSDLPDGQPLFESIFVFENSGNFTERLNGSVQIGKVRHLFKTNYPLAVQVSPAENLAIRIEYDCGRFRTETIRRMLSHLETLLRGFVAAPDQPIYALSMMSEEETRELLWKWNETRTVYPNSSTIHGLFEAQVRKTPDAVAVNLESEQLTYAELNTQANKLAHHLRRRGVGPEVFVALCMERGLAMVVGILGTLKAGGACVPLNTSYPKGRLGFILSDTHAPVVLTQTELAERFREQDQQTTIISLDDKELLAGEREDDPVNYSHSDNLAYLIYTSGSMGVPKGAGVCHRGIVRLVLGQDYAQLGSADILLQVATSSFDASFFELWGALLHGARCVLLPGEDLSTFELGRTLAKHQVSVLLLTTPRFNSVVDTEAEVLSGVPQVLVGGEALSVTHVRRAVERLPATQIINVYGPTENTTITCYYHVPRQSGAVALGSIPIGYPISNTQTYVLGQQQNLVPVYVIGELYTGGDGLARGYLNDPGVTAEKFIPNAFSKEPGSRLYRTGDLARYLPGGEIEFLGRLDGQVKIRGFRIELGEIEAALREHPQVSEAVVLTRESESVGVQLLAYVVAEGDEASLPAELSVFLKRCLPEYMIPSVFVRLESLPLTPNAKIDRRALAERHLNLPERGESYAAPRTFVEELLVEIWSGALGIEKVGIRDDFLQLGGHSLLAIQLLSRIREAFQIELPVRSLFESPTIAEFAKEINRALGSEQDLPSPPLVRASREESLPLSFAQQRLWIIDQLEPGLPVYNIPLAITIWGRLDANTLAMSLGEVVRRHEALRTSFQAAEGLPVQVIAPPQGVPLQVVDLGSLPATEREAMARRLATEEGQRQFDLSKGPLLRASLFRLDEEEHILVLTTHHIVSDGGSLEVLMSELSTLYQDFSKGVAPSLPELPIQYADYASWQRQWLQDEVLERQLAYWREQLSGATAGLDLPSDRSRPGVQTFNGDRLPIELSTQLSGALKTLSRNERATPFMVLLAGFESVLHRYSGEVDLLVGTVVAGRNRVETEKLIGFFINTLVLRTDFSGDPSFRDILGRVREVVLGAYSHQDMPFERVVEELQPERNLSLSPLFQVLFTFHHAPASPPEIPGLSMDVMEVETGSAKFDLYLLMRESEQGFAGTLEYNRDLFDDATMTRLLGHFRRMLEGVAAAPDLPISRQPLLLPEEQRLMEEWNGCYADYPRDLCIHELFEMQVERTPEAVALVCAGERLTYRALDERANQLAHRLRSLGMGPEVVAGIFMGRTPESVTALLAILKTGGAYLPLDPAYPKERIAFMLADVQARVLLTEEYLLESLPPHDAVVVLLTGDGREYQEESTRRPPLTACPTNLAYLIYTSGSTGRPKGVSIEHRNVVAFLHWVRETYSSNDLSGVLATTSFCFDISVFELFAPLSWGGTTILVENALSLLTLDTTEGITLVDVVPSAMAEVLRATQLPDSVRTVNLPGEPIPAELITRLYQQENVERIYNLYGPSEDTTYSTFALAERGSLRPPPAGRPIANSQVFLLDKELGRCPLRVAGEVFIGGDGLSRGYYDRSDLTAERFVPNPFCTQPGERMYRTGDLARYRLDGQIEVLGRADHQVKVRGFRVELGEIEAALTNHNAVREAVVLAREDVLGDKRLVAYVVPQSEANPSRDELQSFLREKLPDYLIPSGFVMLDRLPVLPNGKINRVALPPPANIRPTETEEYVSPPDELEDAIAAVWQSVLGAPKIGVHDNFFSDLGGHSLLAIQTVTRLRESLSPELSFVAMFQFPTVGSLAEHLRIGGNRQPSNRRVADYALGRREALRKHRLRRNSRTSASAVRKDG